MIPFWRYLPEEGRSRDKAASGMSKDPLKELSAEGDLLVKLAPRSSRRKHAAGLALTNLEMLSQIGDRFTLGGDLTILTPGP